MAKPTIITITVDSDPSGLGDMEGLNGEATMEKYLELLQAALEAAYPGVTVQIETQRGGYDNIVVTYDDGSEVSTNPQGERDVNTVTIEGIMQDVTDGKHGDYMVPA